MRVKSDSISSEVTPSPTKDKLRRQPEILARMLRRASRKKEVRALALVSEGLADDGARGQPVPFCLDVALSATGRRPGDAVQAMAATIMGVVAWRKRESSWSLSSGSSS